MSHAKNAPRTDDELVASLSEVARRVATDGVGAEVPPSAWHRLQETRAGRTAPRARWRLTLAVAAGLALAWGAWRLQRTPALTYVVSGGQVEANGYVRGGEAGDTELAFSDGTHVRLARGTRMSVSASGPRGAHLRVEDGQAHFEVTHRPGADWSVEAGPYRVQVTGTVFDVRWSGTDEAATVWLRSGAVRVTGPQLAAPVVLAAGQRLDAHLATAQVRIESERAAPPPVPVTVPVPISAPPPAPPREPTPAPVAPREAPAESPPPAIVGHKTPRAASQLHSETWPSRVAAGESARVLAEARARSWAQVLATVDARALGALADAARYSRERGTADEIFGEFRRRFPTSPEARAAAFLLGRNADDAGDPRAALAWYERYRTESARGPYAAEALGREMLAIERLSGRSAARATARAYLDRFPEGTYILQARAILGLP